MDVYDNEVKVMLGTKESALCFLSKEHFLCESERLAVTMSFMSCGAHQTH